MSDSNVAFSLIEQNLKLEKHVEEDKVDVTLFKQIVGSLWYVSNNRPGIGFSVELVNRYMDEPKVSHMNAARTILRYLKGSLNCGILFLQYIDDKEIMINYYSHPDWCGDKKDRRDTTGYFFQVFGASNSWCSRKQHVVALSSSEVEYIT